PFVGSAASFEFSIVADLEPGGRQQPYEPLPLRRPRPALPGVPSPPIVRGRLTGPHLRGSRTHSPTAPRTRWTRGTTGRWDGAFRLRSAWQMNTGSSDTQTPPRRMAR